MFPGIAELSSAIQKLGMSWGGFKAAHGPIPKFFDTSKGSYTYINEAPSEVDCATAICVAGPTAAAWLGTEGSEL